MWRCGVAELLQFVSHDDECVGRKGLEVVMPLPDRVLVGKGQLCKLIWSAQNSNDIGCLIQDFHEGRRPLNYEEGNILFQRFVGVKARFKNFFGREATFAGIDPDQSVA